MKKEIKTELGTYIKSLITNEFTYYVNPNECDENGNTMMFRNSSDELVSDNYFAFSDYLNNMEKLVNGELTYSFVDEKALKDFKQYYKEFCC